MSELKDRILQRIASSGPLTVADYMTECLMNPKDGYYTTQSPLGRGGDFITAPEISQMFGECLGLALAQAWLDQGAPSPFLLAELGPGRGTLLMDVLRATRGVPGFHDAMSLHLVEISPALKSKQASNLKGYAATWHDDLHTLPALPLFLLANEFFDALPVRQFLRDGSGWRERVVGAVNGELAFGLTEVAPVEALATSLPQTKDGDLVEVSPASSGVAAEIGIRIAQNGGAALVVDYGHWGETGDTFQAVREHRKTNPLEAPGESDLTAHVDFRELAAASAPAAHSGLTPQGVTLERLGITQRAQALAENLHGSALESHVAAHRRLTHPDEMGRLFQVLALYPAGAPVPPGVDP